MNFLTSFRFRIALGFALIGLATSAIALYLANLQFQQNQFEEKQDKLLAIAANAALQIDGDAHATLTQAADMESETYNELQRIGFAIAATNSEILYVYTMRMDEERQIYFILDAGHEPGASPEDYEPSEIGLVYEEPSDILLENFQTMRRPTVEPEFYTDEFGTYLTAYAPFFRSDGSFEGIVAVDILAQDIIAEQENFINTSLAFLLVSTLISAVLGWLVGTWTSRPILDLARDASGILSTNTKIQASSNISEVVKLVDSFNQMLEKLSQNETTVMEQAQQLDQQNDKLQTSLEQLDKRGREFQVVSRVTQTITSSQRLDDLLLQTTQVISEQFGFYHVGIFLIDQNREYAVLAAANSEGGQRMLARSHRLRIGRTGIVGNVASSGTVRVALDTGSDAIYFNNPDLPDTHSEMALPLFGSGREIIGVLDVQSTETNAFGQEDIQVLSTLADQVAIAINNARLFEETQRALKESEAVYRSELKAGWARYSRAQKLAGVQRRGLKTNFLGEPVEIPGAGEAVRSGDAYQRTDDSSTEALLTVPMKLRGEVVGVLNLRSNSGREWTPDEMDIINAIIERAALSIENARLLEESRRTAERERTIGEISTRISAGTEIETILKTAVRELGTQISGTQVTIEIGGEGQ